MSGFLAIYLREMIILKRKFLRLLSSMAISPLLYLLAFGYGMGDTIQIADRSYIEFLIPGLIAMTSMTQAFSIAMEINVSRFYFQIFEEFQAAPVSNIAYVSGEILAGITRAFLSVSIIIVLGYFFGVRVSITPLLLLGVFLNAFVFASLAVALAMLVKSHADQSLLNSFIITPMAFLGGTFFPVNKMPDVVQVLLSFLPLTHASKIIRAEAFNETPDYTSYMILFIIGVVFFYISHLCVDRAKD
jgi:Nod factor-specific ABC transporter NodJ protein